MCGSSAADGALCVACMIVVAFLDLIFDLFSCVPQEGPLALRDPLTGWMPAVAPARTCVTLTTFFLFLRSNAQTHAESALTVFLPIKLVQIAQFNATMIDCQII